MMSRAHGNAVLVEDLGDVMRMGALHIEGDDRPLILGGADDTHTVDRAHPGHGAVHQRALMLHDGDTVMAVDPADRGAQPDGIGDGRRSGLEFVRHVGIGDMRLVDIGDHLAAAHIGGKTVQPVAAGIERADPGGAIELVAGKDEEVAAQRLDVDRQMHRRLRPVEQNGNVMGARDGADAGHVIHRAQHIGHVGDRNQPGARINQVCQLFVIQLAGFRNVRPFKG